VTASTQGLRNFDTTALAPRSLERGRCAFAFSRGEISNAYRKGSSFSSFQIYMRADLI